MLDFFLKENTWKKQRDFYDSMILLGDLLLVFPLVGHELGWEFV